MLRNFQISKLRSLLNSKTPSIFRKNLISDACVCDRTLSVITQKIHHFMTISESWDQNCFAHSKLCLFRQFSCHSNRIVQSSHYCTKFAYSGIQFFVLTFVTNECNPKVLKLLCLLQCRSVHFRRTDQGFFKSEEPQFRPCLFSFRWCRMHLHVYLMALEAKLCRRKQYQIISE